ncbi:MAG: response regulator transcription factor [Elusimicrobiales bacterium]|nr:response regulator transcription factor [Elusimicrobiales bacterium]MCK5582735.1 response regulator transcription factor [Elusimicrobiales bacterium]
MKRILLVEDEESYVNIMTQILESANYKVLVSNTVKNALNIAEATHLNLMIVDWNLPDKSGIEFVKTIRENKKFDNTRIVMNTIRDSDTNQIEAYNCKVDFYFTKPIQPEIFLRKIQTLIGI